MKPLVRALLVPLALGPLSAEAEAQDVFRRSYTFLERQLSIEVLAETPGVLHVMRGQPGQLAVTARSEGGFPEFALSGQARDRLQLTAAGAAAAEFVVVIPEHVQLHLALPGSYTERMPHAAAARYAWPGAAGGAADATQRADPATRAGLAPSRAPASSATLAAASATTVTYRAAAAPQRLHLPDLASVRTLEVRIRGSEFAILASRPLDLPRGDVQRLELRTAGDPLDLVIHVPESTQDFVLSAGSVTALTVSAGAGQSRCAPLIAQRLPGEQRFTFAPTSGALSCR